jgi:hypothetical protein
MNPENKRKDLKRFPKEELSEWKRRLKKQQQQLQHELLNEGLKDLNNGKAQSKQQVDESTEGLD